MSTRLIASALRPLLSGPEVEIGRPLAEVSDTGRPDAVVNTALLSGPFQMSSAVLNSSAAYSPDVAFVGVEPFANADEKRGNSGSKGLHFHMALPYQTGTFWRNTIRDSVVSLRRPAVRLSALDRAVLLPRSYRELGLSRSFQPASH